MSSNSSDSSPARSGGFQSMLARLRGMVQAMKMPEPEASESQTAGWESPVPPGPAPAVAEPETPAGPAERGEDAPPAAPVAAEPVDEAAPSSPVPAGPFPTAEPEAPPAPTVDRVCPLCQSPRAPDRSYCDSCG